MRNEYTIDGDITRIRLTLTIWTTIRTIDLPRAQELKYFWRYNAGTGYVEGSLKGKKTLLHRLLNNTPDRMLTDHINRDRLDNRAENLRTVTWSESLHNRTRYFRNNTSGYKGVIRFGDKWRAQLCVNYERMMIGVFETSEEAARAYDRAKVRYCPTTPVDTLNFPEEHGTR
jgi:hypothetical protein